MRKLVFKSGKRAGKTIVIDEEKEQLSIGRAIDNDIFIDDPTLSKHHAELIRRGYSYYIRDLGSKNGIFIGEDRVTESHLDADSELSIGDNVISLVEELNISENSPVSGGFRDFESDEDSKQDEESDEKAVAKGKLKDSKKSNKSIRKVVTNSDMRHDLRSLKTLLIANLILLAITFLTLLGAIFLFFLKGLIA